MRRFFCKNDTFRAAKSYTVATESIGEKQNSMRKSPVVCRRVSQAYSRQTGGGQKVASAQTRLPHAVILYQNK